MLVSSCPCVQLPNPKCEKDGQPSDEQSRDSSEERAERSELLM